jgi:putative nucleotidyltransferase with HDIG domain
VAKTEIRGIPDSPRSGVSDPARRRHWQLSLIVLTGSFLIAAVLVMPSWLGTGGHGRIPQVGEISDRDHKAPEDLEIVDEQATEVLRKDAIEQAPAVYDFDPRRGPELRRRVSQAFAAARLSLSAEPGDEGGAAAPAPGAAFEAALGQEFAIEPATLDALAAQQFSSTDEQRMIEMVAPLARRLIVDDSGQLARQVEKRHVVISDLGAEGETRPLKAPDSVLSVDAARELVDAEAATRLSEVAAPHREALISLARSLVRPNLVFNLRATEERRLSAEQGVKPVTVSLRQGEIIVRDGDPINERHVLLLRGMYQQQVRASRFGMLLGTALLLILISHVVWRFGSSSFRKFARQPRDAIFLTSVLLTLAAGTQLMIYVLDAVGQTPTFRHIVEQMPSVLYFGVPVAAATMLVRMVHNAETALPFAIVSAMLAGLQVRQDLGFAVFALAGGLTAAAGAARVQQRGTLLRAGGKVALANGAAICALFLLESSAPWPAFGVALTLGLVSGAISGVIVTGLAPAVEYLFNYTTDIKLLELANRENSLLRELEMRAPGTYHHSMMVGHLAEKAAEAIGANTIECKVAAYYHDIGKMRRPQFFVENATIHGENRHEKLAPSMSARIIQAHVKDGAEMGEKHKLADPILRGIRQHHGTSIIRFFFERAKELNDPEKGEVVNEHDYRYPGPKPQTREAGILMLADSVEAASRTLADTSSARVRQLVQRIINNYFRDGQLEECSLTLRDLHAIARTFIDTLSAIRHDRIDYPEPTDEKGRKLDLDSDEGLVERLEPRAKDRQDAAAASRDDDLPRLGLP